MVTFSDDFSDGQKKDNGWFPVPHSVFLGAFTKSELILLLALYKLQNRYGGAESAEFHHSNLKLCLLTRMSEKTVIQARKGLVAKGVISSQRGSTGKETRYHVISGNEHKIKSVRKAIDMTEKKNKSEALRQKKESQLEKAMKGTDGSFLVDVDDFYSVWADRYNLVKAKLNGNFDWVTSNGNTF